MDHLSIYVAVADLATLPYGWSRYARFRLTLVNQFDRITSTIKGIFFFILEAVEF